MALSPNACHVRQFGHDLSLVARRGSGRDVHPDASQRVPARRAARPQGFQPADAALAPGATGFHALAYPYLFLGQQLVGLGGDHRLLRQLLGLLLHVLSEVARERQQATPVEFDDPGGNAVQERAVVRDRDHAAWKCQQQLFQPFDGIHIEVVGRLVEEQYVGPGHKRLRQGDPLFQATGQVAHAGLGVQVQPLHRFLHPALPVPALHGLDLGLQRIQVGSGSALVALPQRDHVRQPCGCGLEHRMPRVQQRFLRHIGDPQALLDMHGPIIRMRQPP